MGHQDGGGPSEGLTGPKETRVYGVLTIKYRTHVYGEKNIQGIDWNPQLNKKVHSDDVKGLDTRKASVPDTD